MKPSAKIYEYCAQMLKDCISKGYVVTFAVEECDTCGGTVEVAIVVWSEKMQKNCSAQRVKTFLEIDQAQIQGQALATMHFNEMVSAVDQFMQPTEQHEGTRH